MHSRRRPMIVLAGLLAALAGCGSVLIESAGGVTGAGGSTVGPLGRGGGPAGTGASGTGAGGTGGASSSTTGGSSAVSSSSSAGGGGTGGSGTGGGDACSTAPPGESVLGAAVGGGRSCAILSGGALKCWGYVWGGFLGLGDMSTRGDGPNEMGSNLPAVDLGTGRTASAVSLGYLHTCAVLDDGSVKCWGGNLWGELGLGDTQTRGDQPGQMGDALPAVDLGAGATAVAVSAGYGMTCALLTGGRVKCWGTNDYGQLGLGDTIPHGTSPGEMGNALPAVDLGTGRSAVAISVGSASDPIYDHACALLDDGSVKCWGGGGQIGLGDELPRGDKPGEMGDALPAVDLGTGKTAVAVAAGYGNACALLSDGTLKCWGGNYVGQLGLGDTTPRGDQPGEMGDTLPAVDLGTCQTPAAVLVGQGASAGGVHTCALLTARTLKCWGEAGALGLGDLTQRGSSPGEMGDALPTVKLFSNAW